MASDWADKIVRDIIARGNAKTFALVPGKDEATTWFLGQIADALRAERALYEVAWAEVCARRSHSGGAGAAYIAERERAHDAARKEAGLA